MDRPVYNMKETITIVIDETELYVQPRDILPVVDQGFLRVENPDYLSVSYVGELAQVAILALTVDMGTCGLNDLGSGSNLPDEGRDWPLVAEGTLCWYEDISTDHFHRCAACQSILYHLYDTGLRLPAMRGYSAAI